MKLENILYERSALEFAPLLLGKLLCIAEHGKVLRFRVTETECYCGETDTACHAHKGKTERTKILYNQGGCAYVYLCYGIHNLFNIVTGREGVPQAVLVRSVEGYNGPGKLTKAMKIDRSFNGESLITSERIWVEDDGYTGEYETAKRVGIDFATEEYREKPWRFILQQAHRI